jgi:hypothetical protein
MTTVLMLLEGLGKASDYLEHYHNSFEANLDSYNATTELLATYGESMRQFLAGMDAVVKISGENQVAINETNEHLKTLIAKFDSHFGDAAGLEYDN